MSTIAIKGLPCTENTKTDDIKGKTIFPDIIVHSRGNDLKNLLIIEIKKESNKSKIGNKNDILKLKTLTASRYEDNPDYNYRYRYGIHLIFGTEKVSYVDVYTNRDKDDDLTEHLKTTLKDYGLM